MKQQVKLPVVQYKQLPESQITGRHYFQVVKSQSPFWKSGVTFSDDDMSMGSRQVRFELVK
jgi:hypothetical protein